MRNSSKKYFTLSQVSRLTNLKIHTVKYWCKEFNFSLTKNSSGRKIFTQSDIDNILLIKHLRQQEKLTLSGIKRRLKDMKELPKSKQNSMYRKNLLWIQKELLAVKNLLQQST